MKNLNTNQQLKLLQNIFPDASRIEWWTETRNWAVSTICGPDENIDYYTYIPGTKKFHFNYRISIEV